MQHVYHFPQTFLHSFDTSCLTDFQRYEFFQAFISFLDRIPAIDLSGSLWPKQGRPVQSLFAVSNGMLSEGKANPPKSLSTTFDNRMFNHFPANLLDVEGGSGYKYNSSVVLQNCEILFSSPELSDFQGGYDAIKILFHLLSKKSKLALFS